MIVVGGGPGGLSSAVYLSQKGLKVKVFEKKKLLGKPVRCGEYFPTKDEMARLLPRVKCIDIIDAPEDAVDSKCKSIRLVSPRGHEFEFPFAAYILDRHVFESHLGDIARGNGADIDVGVQAHFYPDDQGGWVGPTREQADHGEIIIAADGYPSETAERAGLPERRDLLTGFIEKNKVAAERLRGGQKASLIGDSLPVDGPLAKTYTDRVMAVGDAAGMVMPTNGGGIQTAMITGRLAGEAAVRYLEEKIPLSSYEEAWKDQIGVEMENSKRMRQASDRLMGHGFFFDMMLRIIGTKRIADVIMCQVPSGMGPFMHMLA